MAIEVPLTKDGPVLIKARMQDYVLDIEISEEEARALEGKLALLLKYRQASVPVSRFGYDG